MTIDVNFLRVERSGDPDRVVKDQLIRGMEDPAALVQNVLKLDMAVRNGRKDLELCTRAMRDVGGKLRNLGSSYSGALMEELSALKSEIKHRKKALQALEVSLNSELSRIGNRISYLNPLLFQFLSLEKLPDLFLGRSNVAFAKSDLDFSCLSSYFYDLIEAKTKHPLSVFHRMKNRWMSENHDLPILFHGNPYSRTNTMSADNASMILLCAGNDDSSDAIVFAILQRALALLRLIFPDSIWKIEPEVGSKLELRWSFALKLVRDSVTTVLLIANTTDFDCRTHEIRSGPKKMSYIDTKKKYTHTVEIFTYAMDQWSDAYAALKSNLDLLKGISLEPLSAKENEALEVFMGRQRNASQLDFTKVNLDMANQLDVWLTYNSFLGGNLPDKSDLQLRQEAIIFLSSLPKVQYPHIARWLQTELPHQ